MGRSVSPVFVGRETELEFLGRAFDLARKQQSMTVLLGGEAGVGKTRLLSCFAERAARDGAHVLSGACIELSSDGLAYAPFTAALRQLVREIGADTIAALLPEGGTRDLARLLPEFGEPAGERENETARARLFEQFLTLLERLAERRPLILLVEDVHWADRSSRDLIAFLSRNLGPAPVLLVLTYRSDELHRQHPLRPVLAELGRLSTAVRLELPRLSRAEVAAQMAGILGTAPEYARVEQVYRRSEGIPLFVEALLECGDGDCDFPDSLHDLITRSVERLPEETQQVLRIAAAGGLRVGHALLAAVSGLSDLELEAALRPAIAANVIQVDGRAYAFRHALIREAVHDELLPGEHVRLHARYATEIEADRSLVPPGRAAIEIAHHWYSARDDLWALISAWEAAEKAAQAFAYTEQLQLLDRVLTLWGKIPDAAERIGADLATVLENAADAALAVSEVDRGMKYVKAALAELDPAREPERVAELYVRLAHFKTQRHRPGALADLRYAESLVPRPGRVRGHVLVRLSAHLMFHGQVAEGTALAHEGLRFARELGDQVLEGELLLNLSIGQSMTGDLEESIATNDRVFHIGERLGHGRLMLRALGNNVDALNNMGRSAEAVELAVEGEELARRYGQYRYWGLFIVNNRAEALEALGRWDEAVAAIEQALTMEPTHKVRHHMLRVRADIAIGRGETELAERILAEIGALGGAPEESTQELTLNARLALALHLLRGAPRDALDAAERILTQRPRSDKSMLGWRLMAEIRHVCDAAAATDPARVAAVRAKAEAYTADMVTDGPAGEAYRLMYQGDFDAAAAVWERLDRPHPRARALLAAAHEAARAGDRDGAARRLTAALPVARALDARPLAEEIESLLRRVGGGTDGAAAPNGAGGGPAALTPRELEVLRLVAAGRSNRDIAAELFISAKTVSVHVSNILAKLGVSTRTEATAAAHRLALLR